MGLRNGVQMRAFWKRYGWVLLGLWLAGGGLAQPVTHVLTPVADTLRWNFDKIRFADGLPHNYVRCLHRDQLGHLWFGTKGGLSRYDGVRLTSYSAGTPLNALPADEVFALAETPGRWLWVSTFGGLARYDYRTGKLESVATPGLPLARSGGVGALFIDRDAHLWVSDDEQLVRYTIDAAGRLGAGVVFAHLSRTPVNELAQTPDGTIWVAAENKALYALRPAGRRWRVRAVFLPHHSALDEAMLARCLYADPQGILWMGTYTDGIIRYDPRTNRYRHLLFYRPARIAERLVHNKVRGLAEGRAPNGDRLLYCATATDGLVIYNLNRETFTACKTDPSNADGLAADNVRKLLIDPDHNLWLATEQGVNVYKPSAHKIQFVALSGHLADPPYIDRVTEARNRAGHRVRYLTQIDVGTWQHDLARNQFRPITGPGREPLITVPVIDERGRWWVGAANSFGRLNPQTGRYTPVVRLKSGEKPTVPWPFSIGNGRFLIWLNGRARLLNPERPADTLCRQFNAGISDANPIHLRQVTYDVRSGLWAVGEQSSLLVNIPDLRYPDQWRTQPIRVGNQLVGDCYGIRSDTGRHCLWLFASNGLFQWSLAGRPMRYYGTSNGLAESSILSLMPGGPNHLWLVGNKGLSRLNLTTGRAEFYGAQDGFRAYGQYQYSGPGTAKYFFIGGPRGYHLVDRTRLHQSAGEARVFLTQVQLENQLIAPEAVTQSLTSPRVVAAGQNDLYVDFVALDGTYVGHNKYRYQLTGYDEHWHQPTSQTNAVYTNLSPGSYRLRVQATNSDGVWSRQEAVFAFVIEPPVWQRWWFIGLLISLVIGLLYGLYRYRLNQVLARERLRQRIAHDLHDEIGSTLSSISLLSGLINTQLLSPANESARQMVQKIHADARHTLEAIDEIIWAVNPGNDSLQRVVLRIQEYAQPLMEAQHVSFALTVDPRLNDRSLPMDLRQSLYFVMKEALNNLLKYAGATRAQVHIGVQGGQLQVTITDNGRGFDPQRVDTRTGRRSMQQRARAVGGQLHIDSAPGQGTQVRLLAPLP